MEGNGQLDISASAEARCSAPVGQQRSAKADCQGCAGLPRLRPGEGAGRFIGDLHNGESDEVMRQRWKDGDYGKLRADYVAGWRKMAGRK